MNRQQAIRLLLQPLLSLLVLAIRTMPVAARAPNPVLMMALSAFKDHMPQLSCATPLNGAEHFTLLECDLVMTMLKKRLAMLPQTVGDSGHQAERGEGYLTGTSPPSASGGSGRGRRNRSLITRLASIAAVSVRCR